MTMEVDYNSEIMLPKFKFLGKEEDLESMIVSNLDEIANNCGWVPIKSIERQYLIYRNKKRSILDILITHLDGSRTITEVKSGTNCSSDYWSGLGQLLYYGKLVGNVTGSFPRLVFAAPIIHDEMISLINYFQLPIEVLMVDNDRAICVK